jgi:iron complex transport system substrate-binding protein
MKARRMRPMSWFIRSPLMFVASMLFAMGVALAATGSAAADASQTYPIVIKHAFGTTTIQEKPKRIATVAWANHEVPLALGAGWFGRRKFRR